MGVPPQQFHCTKQLGFQFQDQDSSSSQSTGQSSTEVASMGEGYSGSHGKPVEGHMNVVASSMATQDFAFPPPQSGYCQTMAHIPVHFADPYLGSLLAAYGPQGMLHHQQMLGMAPNRVPLPLDFSEDEPIFVNAKQYNAILRRRRYRAKLEAQQKLIKVRKPYLHESRHLHALRRARGSGGRFLNSKNQEDSNPARTIPGVDENVSTQLRMVGQAPEPKVHRQENQRDSASTTSRSDVTSASNSRNIIYQQPQFKFSGYSSHISGAPQGYPAAMHGGGRNQHHVPILS